MCPPRVLLYAGIKRSLIGISTSSFKILNMLTSLEFLRLVFKYKKDVELIEQVQRRATKHVPGLRDMEYSDRLKHLKLPTLVFRRIRGDMIEIYKIIKPEPEEEFKEELVFEAEPATRKLTKVS